MNEYIIFGTVFYTWNLTIFSGPPLGHARHALHPRDHSKYNFMRFKPERVLVKKFKILVEFIVSNFEMLALSLAQLKTRYINKK
jgi:hypothetical protein